MKNIFLINIKLLTKYYLKTIFFKFLNFLYEIILKILRLITD